MSYKSALQANNIDLSEILTSINELPNNSSGGSSSGEVSLQEKTITPTKSTQTVVADSSYDGLSKVTVNAIPSNYITTTDANATENDIVNGKTSYVNGTKITGTLVVQNYYISDVEPTSSIGEDGDLYFVRGE